VNEELGGEGVVNGFGLPVSRRRALAIAEDDRPSDFLYMAPLPGDGQDAHAPAFDAPPIPPTDADEPFELSDTFEDTAEAGELEALEGHAAARPNEDPPMTFEPEFHSLPPGTGAESRQEFMPAPPKGRASPLPFSAPSLTRRAVQDAALLSEPEAEPAISALELEEVESREPIQFEPARAVSEPQPFRGDWSNAPLDELGLVQLVQRLGASLERRRELLASAVASAPAPHPALSTGFDPAPAEEAAQAMAAYFNKSTGDAPAIADGRHSEGGQPVAIAPADPAPLPNFLGSWPTADDDDFDAMPSFTLPLRKAVAPTIAFDEPEQPENDEDIEDAHGGEPDDSYSSLLTMHNPFAPKDNGFVRVEEPAVDDDVVEPAVVFPGHREAALAPAITGHAGARVFDPPAGAGTNSTRIGAAPADADAALRAALATLQRMSGTA
jgi:hypothetical protein